MPPSPGQIIETELTTSAAAVRDGKRGPRLQLVLGLIAGAAALGGLGQTAYYLLFSMYAHYDDEGYLLITLKQFFGGHALYDEVYTQYGPFYYWFHWFVLRAGSFTLGHDWMGLVVIGLWLASAALNGVC